MYSNAFCRVYNEFGWNYFPRAFGEQLLEWIRLHGLDVRTSMDLGCGTGVLCEVLQDAGISAAGMDLSEGMIAIARESRPEIHYDVANMISYRPQQKYDLVTCTGDAINHIMDMDDIETIFRNVYSYLNDGGHFIFDLLNEKEVPKEEPFDLDFSETIKARFQVTQNRDGVINLNTTVYENGEYAFEENISEIVHDAQEICRRLQSCGFELLQCDHKLLPDSENQAATWYVIARKSKTTR